MSRIIADVSPTERSAALAYQLAHGRAVTPAYVANHYHMTPSGARRLLERMGRVLPIVEEGGVWRIMPTNEKGGGVVGGQLVGIGE
jgi:hypothetical protein